MIKKQVANLLSKTVHLIALKSSSTVCDWRTYQVKVPQKLLEEQKKKFS